MGFPKVEFITVEDAVKVAIDRLELVEPELRLWLWDEFAQVSFTTDDQFIIGYEQAKEDAITLLTNELARKDNKEGEQIDMDVMCDDNRFEVIAKAKAHLLEATNIDTSEDEMKVLDNFLFRCWQMGWLDRYDRGYDERRVQGTGDCDHCTKLFTTCPGR